MEPLGKQVSDRRAASPDLPGPRAFRASSLRVPCRRLSAVPVLEELAARCLRTAQVRRELDRQERFVSEIRPCPAEGPRPRSFARYRGQGAGSVEVERLDARPQREP